MVTTREQFKAAYREARAFDRWMTGEGGRGECAAWLQASADLDAIRVPPKVRRAAMSAMEARGRPLAP